jgi:hypothetical protein
MIPVTFLPRNKYSADMCNHGLSIVKTVSVFQKIPIIIRVRVVSVSVLTTFPLELPCYPTHRAKGPDGSVHSDYCWHSLHPLVWFGISILWLWICLAPHIWFGISMLVSGNHHHSFCQGLVFRRQ